MAKAVREHRPLAPTTTVQEDIVTAGQRTINKIWEFTQALVALLVTAVFLYCEVKKINSEAVKMAFTLVIGFYFSRTNHQAIGGHGKKPQQKYIGR